MPEDHPCAITGKPMESLDIFSIPSGFTIARGFPASPRIAKGPSAESCSQDGRVSTVRNAKDNLIPPLLMITKKA